MTQPLVFIAAVMTVLVLLLYAVDRLHLRPLAADLVEVLLTVAAAFAIMDALLGVRLY